MEMASDIRQQAPRDFDRREERGEPHDGPGTVRVQQIPGPDGGGKPNSFVV